jgi:hypothetical protein
LSSVPGPAEDLAHLLLEAARVEAVDVVVAVVGEEQPAGLDVRLEPLALGAAEADQLVTGHEEEGEGQQLVGVGGDDDFLRVDRDGGVLDHRIQHVGGNLGVVVPVARSRSAAARTRTRTRGAGPSARHSGGL